MRVSIVGAGYVGLVTGIGLAEKGHTVVCVDVDRRKVDQINEGNPPFYEPGLQALLRRNLGRRFRASDELEHAVLHSDLTLIAVGTPSKGGRIDLAFVRRATRQIGRALSRKKGYHVVVVRSTVLPGTTDGVLRPILERSSGKPVGEEVGLCVSPEFLSEGEAVGDFLEPDRIVAGAVDRRSLATLERLYRPFAGVPILRTGTRAAEMIKYTSNAMLATLISFSNEIGNLCAAVGGIDAEEVMQGVHLSQYLSPRAASGERVRAPITGFLRAGCGFGGSCLPKDVQALVAHGRRVGSATGLLQQVLRINQRQPHRMLTLLRRHFSSLERLPVTVLGLAFKPGTDDLRKSPALPVVRLLISAGARVTLYDPVAIPAARRARLFEGATFAPSLGQAVASAKAVLLVTAWPEFRALEKLPRRRRESLVVVDGRRLLDRGRFERYEGIGLAPPG